MCLLRRPLRRDRLLAPEDRNRVTGRRLGRRLGFIFLEARMPLWLRYTTAYYAAYEEDVRASYRAELESPPLEVLG